MNDAILGIDLGTTKCLAAVAIEGKAHDLEIRGGRYSSAVLPSLFIQRTRSGQKSEILVGKEAEVAAEENVKLMSQLIRQVKRYMRFDRDKEAHGQQPFIRFESGGEFFDPSEIAAEFLKKIRISAEEQQAKFQQIKGAENLNWSNWTSRAVITVPAYFGHSERSATRLAAQRAGFRSVTLLKEPTAAALQYAVHTRNTPQYVLVVDLGGGTCDLTVLYTDGTGKISGLRELGVFGDNLFGGLEWDFDIARICHRKATLQSRTDGMDDPPPLRGDRGMPNYEVHANLLSEAERNKRVFSDRGAELLPTPLVPVSTGRETDGFLVDFTLDEFRKISRGHAQYCIRLCDLILESIRPITPTKNGNRDHLTWEDLDDVLLVGGGAGLIEVQDALKTRFDNPKRQLIIRKETQSAIGRGAALYGELMQTLKGEPPFEKLRCLFDTGYVYQDDSAETPRERTGRSGRAGGPSLRYVYRLNRNIELPSPWFGTSWETADLPTDDGLLLELVVKKYSRWHQEGRDVICCEFHVEKEHVQRARKVGVLRLHFRYNAVGALEYRVIAGDRDAKPLKVGNVPLSEIEHL